MSRPSSLREHYDRAKTARTALRMLAATRPLLPSSQMVTTQTAVQQLSGAAPASLEAAPPLTSGASPELRLYADIQRLKELQSVTAKIALKKELFPSYLGWIDGTLAVPSSAQNDMLMHLMVWSLDTHEFAVSSRIAEYALLNGLVMPEPYKRDVASIYAEQLAEGVLNEPEQAAQYLGDVERAIELTKSSDIVDEIRAKLFKAYGNGLYETRPKDALVAYQTAKRLNDKVGVSKLIEKLQRLIKAGGVAESPRDTPDGSQLSTDPVSDPDDAGTTVQPDAAD